MIVKLLTEHNLEFLSLKGGPRGSSESTNIKMPHCWNSHATTHIFCTKLLHAYLLYVYILDISAKTVIGIDQPMKSLGQG